MGLGREKILVYYANGIMLNLQVQHTIKMMKIMIV